jgi:hypothetical protein
MQQQLMMASNYPKYVVIYVYNKARWSTVANEGCLYLLIWYIRNRMHSPTWKITSIVPSDVLQCLLLRLFYVYEVGIITHAEGSMQYIGDLSIIILE